MPNGQGTIDFSDLGGKPVVPPATGGAIDFSDLGGKPVAGGAAPSAQSTATEKANLFVPGVGYTQMDVPAGTAKHYEAGYMHGLRQGAGLAAVTGLAGGGMAVTPAATSAVGGALLPSAAHAGELFNDLEDKIGDEPIDVSDVGDIALKARDWWNAGGTRVKQISDFLRRTTDPDQPALTFSEARDFLSNAGRRLSAEEAQKLAPQARRYLAQFASSLNDSIQDVANDAGLGDQYRNAVNEFRGAMKLNNAWETTKEMGAEMAKKAVSERPMGRRCVCHRPQVSALIRRSSHVAQTAVDEITDTHLAETHGAFRKADQDFDARPHARQGAGPALHHPAHQQRQAASREEVGGTHARVSTRPQ